MLLGGLAIWRRKKIVSIIGNPTSDFMDDNDNFKLLILRKIVDAYKIINNLECC